MKAAAAGLARDERGTRAAHCSSIPFFHQSASGMVPAQRPLAIAAPLQDVLSKVCVVLATQAFDPAVARLAFASRDAWSHSAR
jgi:hypothetical protein